MGRGDHERSQLALGRDAAATSGRSPVGATSRCSASRPSPRRSPRAPRRARPRPSATALERYSTWSFQRPLDLAEYVALVDYGDVEDPDGEGGARAGRRRHGGDRTRTSRCASSSAVTTPPPGTRWARSRASTTRTSVSSRSTRTSTCATGARTARRCASSSTRGSTLITSSRSV